MYCNVSRDMSEVGPIDTCGMVPNNTYRKPPENAEYNPFCKNCHNLMKIEPREMYWA